MTHLSAWDQERLRAQLFRTLVRLGLMKDKEEFHRWNIYRVET